MANLTAANGPDAGRKYDLHGQEWVLGRLPECQIVINVGAVSRNHAKIAREGSAYFLEDLKSRNGTYLNNQLLKDRRRLSHGDKVKVCDVEFTFADDIPTAVVETPTPTVNPFVVPALLGGREPGGREPNVLIEEEPASSSTLLSKLDMSSGRMNLNMSASAEVRLQAIVEITQSLGKALALDEVLTKVLNSCFKLFLQADRGFIVLVTDDGRLVPRWTKTRRPGQEDTIRISRTIINTVIEKKEAILSADASSDSQFAMSQSIADFRIRSVMCAPLVDSTGRAFGALQIDTLDQRARFKDDDLDILVCIASQAAIAIDNAQLYERSLQQKEMQRDLELAREVQKGFLPMSNPDVPGYSFFSFYQPAVYVGGDYYDYITLPDGRIAIAVADVVGHGVAAALMMAKLSAEARYCLVSEPNPGAAVSKLNDRITALGLGRFITLILVVLDPKTHELAVVSAGHMAPIIRRKQGGIDEPGTSTGGLPLGLVDGTEYEHETTKLQPGDVAVLYTDGINESSDDKGEQYGIPRIRTWASGKLDSPQKIGQAIVDDVKRFVGKKPQDDDMCVVCFGRTS